MEKLSKAFSYFLILYSTMMLSWGILGFIEYFTQAVFIVPLQNPTFPAGTQFIHWLLITLSGATYLYGYVSRWPYTPLAMPMLFGMLTSMCFIQTFDFMIAPSRYVTFAIECSMYIGISVYLLRSQLMQKKFRKLQISHESIT